MKKVVLKLDLHDDREKQKAIKAVSGLTGIDSIAMDMEKKTMTVVGSVDPVDVVGKLRKLWHVDIDSVGSAKDGGNKGDDGKKPDVNKQLAEAWQAYYSAHPRLASPYYYAYSAEEDPNSSCVIC